VQQARLLVSAVGKAGTRGVKLARAIGTGKQQRSRAQQRQVLEKTAV
jgi:hypothetical protein